MTEDQIINLYSFFFVASIYKMDGFEVHYNFYNISEEDIVNKFNKIIGMNVPKTNYLDRLKNNSHFNRWDKVWKYSGKAENSLLMLLTDTEDRKYQLSEIISKFETYIGNVSSISKTVSDINPYLIRHIRQNVLTRTEIRRELILTSILG